MVDKDVLTDALSRELNKRTKGGTPIQSLLDDSASSIVREWVSTGSSLVDVDISNREHGGFPVGRISIISGLESSGKSLMAAHVIAETQKRDGIAMFIDSEASVDINFLTSIGVNCEKLIYASPTTIEEAFEMIENIIHLVREKHRDKLLTIVLDSIAGAPTKSELEGDYDVTGYNTAKALILSQAMRKLTKLISDERVLLLFTNQIRFNMNAGFGDPYTMPGGKGTVFHASVILRLKNVGMLKRKSGGMDEVYGVRTNIKVIKNKVGPPARSSVIDIHFDSGIYDSGSVLEFLKKYGMVSTSGRSYILSREGHDDLKFTAKTFDGLWKHDDELREYLYSQICEKKIMHYKGTDDFDPEDIEVETADD